MNKAILITVVIMFVIISIFLFAGCGDDGSVTLVETTGPTGITGSTGTTGQLNLTSLRVNVFYRGNSVDDFRVILERLGVSESEVIEGNDSSGAGWYEFNELYPGPHRLTVYSDGYDSRILEIDPGSTEEIDVSLGRWELQDSGVDPNNSLWDVHFIDNRNGWAVGETDGANLTIVNTVDGGVNWSPQLMSGTDTLYGVYLLDDTYGWVVGENESLLYYSGSWASHGQSGNLIDGSWDLNDVFIVDENNAWIVGDNNSDDGAVFYYDGSNWSQQTVPGGTPELYGIYFIDSKTGWASGDEFTILKTSDGGATWTNYSDNPGMSLIDVCFYDNQNGWASGEDMTVLKTEDGGGSWIQIQTLPASTSYDLTSIVFPELERGWAVADEDCRILYTGDGGKTWLFSTTPTGLDCNLYGLSFPEGVSDGWTAGYYGQILHYSE